MIVFNHCCDKIFMPPSSHAYDRVRVLSLRGAPRPRPPVRAVCVPVDEAGADLLAPEVLRAVHAQEEPALHSMDAHVPSHPPQDDHGPREPPPRRARGEGAARDCRCGPVLHPGGARDAQGGPLRQGQGRPRGGRRAQGRQEVMLDVSKRFLDALLHGNFASHFPPSSTSASGREQRRV
ncbi:hypothetical protein GH5_00115 [Leishmania sp. Ghana 2012 LV757]|uniref:hypothetical protein n=1 Tax=Leishmania sp. Ghana 2012 LV757 TaxID=2803181 RepID=UPI001B6A01E6|nr:hypothetical protein GH5_00115 [Leishmania sp. Ghana 2012 LV757]